MSLDQRFVELMDAKRGSLPRSRWIEVQADPSGSAPVVEPRSPVPYADTLAGPSHPDEGGFEALPPTVNKYGDPIGTVYDEDDPRGYDA